MGRASGKNRGGGAAELRSFSVDEDWREQFVASFKKHNGEERSPEKFLEQAAPFYEMPTEKQTEWIRGLVNDGFENMDGERFPIGDSGAIFGEVQVVDEDGDGAPISPERSISVYREVWEPTGEVSEDGTPRFERREDDLLAEVDENYYISEGEAREIRQALLDSADWISLPEDY